jgi:peptidyl-prolyl cis-trans isomerase C
MKLSVFCLFLASVACIYAQVPTPSTPVTPGTPAPPPVRVVVTPAEPDVHTSVPKDKVILSIGDEKITAAEFDQLIETLPDQYRAAARGPNRRQFAEQLIRVKLLAREAQRRKLDQTPVIRRQLELQRENVLASAAFQDIAATTKIEDAAEHQYYEQHKTEYESVHARHILIRMKGSPVPLLPGKKELTDEEASGKAQEVRAKLLAGGDFADLAKAESDDATSAKNGGDLGTFKHGQMIPQFDQSAFSLPIGQVSEPVKTQFGYHVIKVEEHINQTFDQARVDIEKKMRPEVARETVENLRKQTPVTIDDVFFGPSSPQAKR